MGGNKGIRTRRPGPHSFRKGAGCRRFPEESPGKLTATHDWSPKQSLGSQLSSRRRGLVSPSNRMFLDLPSVRLLGAMTYTVCRLESPVDGTTMDAMLDPTILLMNEFISVGPESYPESLRRSEILNCTHSKTLTPNPKA